MTQENQELIEGVEGLPEEHGVDPENQEGEGVEQERQDQREQEGQGDAPEVDPNQLTLTIEGFEEEGEPQEKRADWVTQLRRENRELKKRMKDYERSAPTSPELILGEKPTLASCDYDDEKFERNLIAWTEKKAKIESVQAEKRKAEEAAERAFQERVAKYDEQKRALPFDDYEEAEEAVQSALNHIQLGILVKNAPESAKLVYALGKNEKALQHLAGIKDADTYAFELGKIMERMKTTPTKKPIPAPEKTVRGGSRSFGAATSGGLQKKLDQARANEDYAEVIEIKRQAREQGLTLD